MHFGDLHLEPKLIPRRPSRWAGHRSSKPVATFGATPETPTLPANSGLKSQPTTPLPSIKSANLTAQALLAFPTIPVKKIPAHKLHKLPKPLPPVVPRPVPHAGKNSAH